MKKRMKKLADFVFERMLVVLVLLWYAFEPLLKRIGSLNIKRRRMMRRLKRWYGGIRMMRKLTRYFS